ncbi:aromatic amino acid transport family protein [Vibrio sp. CK2-1]|uniref:aromatic amino acid transport family protein n=1 Tax=Vibrio sp. CK2-1 TaxID=2912249 RepID=UPI001F012F28|nr:aromatic amino acid transport family protein [Vibrio sp. CK2-1]MCF7353626.1 aromatic amino acid transporter [Vibrio sp. CK2-1]
MSSSKILGSTLIIAGTTIGAGMLALPIASAGLGFSTSLIIMIGMWALMAYTALLMLELHQHADYDATLHTLAKQFLGDKGKWIATFAMLFLFYALCAAYIAGGGGQFNEKLHNWFAIDVSNGIGTLIFTIIIAAIVTFGTQSVDRVNRVLFTCKLIAMAVMLFFLTPNIQSVHLLNMPLEKGLIVAALPVIFTSFGFHGSIPAVVRYLNLDMKALKKVMVFGSLLPLVVYILWQLATLGVVDQATLSQAGDVTALVGTLSQVIHSSAISQVVSVFADLALITSFLGVSLGLFEFLGDSLNKNQSKGGRVGIALVTFVPPLCFALFYPQGFIMALGYAAIALAVLAILLPVAMVMRSRALNQDKQDFTVSGGTPALMVTLAAGVVIIVVQVMISLGVLPAIG